MKISPLSILVGLSTIALISSCSTSPLGRKQLMFLPEGQMDAMGVQSFDQLKQQTPVESSSLVNQYIKCVAAPITAVAGPEAGIKEWEIVVFKDNQANAFALPGGKVGVYEGLLKVAKNDSQLAAVIGHEIGHVIARHGNERVSENLAAQGGMAALSLLVGGGGQQGNSALLSSLLGAGAQYGYLLPHSRIQESEADLIGLKLMARAGFDPRQSVELWKNMIQSAQGKSPPEFLSTHPASENRIKALQEHMPEALTLYQQASSSHQRTVCVAP